MFMPQKIHRWILKEWGIACSETGYLVQADLYPGSFFFLFVLFCFVLFCFVLFCFVFLFFVLFCLFCFFPIYFNILFSFYRGSN